MSKRKIVSVHICGDSFYDILDQNTPDQVIECMKLRQELYKGRDIFFDVSSYGYDGGVSLDIWERREETDEEYEKRITKEKIERAIKKKNKADIEAKELAEFERLKAKYGK